jgi:hypothetical protein
MKEEFTGFNIAILSSNSVNSNIIAAKKKNMKASN